MDEIKLIKAILFQAVFYAAYYGVIMYMFDGDFKVWSLAFIPMGRDLLKLIWYSYRAWEVRNEKGLVVLKESQYKAADFVSIVFLFLFVSYIRIDLLPYLFPIAIANLYLLYRVKRNQKYCFQDWSIQNITEGGNGISARNIISIDIQSNKMDIVYLKNEYEDKNDKENRERFTIRREDLQSPQSWYQFEKIVLGFRISLEEKRREYRKKKGILDS